MSRPGPAVALAPDRGASAAWLRPSPLALPERPNADYPAAVRHGLWLLALGFGGFLLWAMLAPIDEGVPLQGMLAVDSKRKRVDHLTGGIIERIAVRDGQRVREGEELVVLNEVQTKASLNAALGQWRLATATVARLQAERDGRKSIAFPRELTGDSQDAETLAVRRAQEDLFASRRTAIEGELRIIRESSRGLERQLASLDQLKTGREKQVQLFNAQLASYQKLNRQGFISQNQLLEFERQLSEIQSKQSEDLANIGGINARLAEFRMRDSQRGIEYRREVEMQLTEAQREASTLAERLAALRDAYSRLVLRAPVSGTVVDVAVHTVGGVVKPGEPLMDIVPDGDELVVESRLPPHLVDRVHAGLPADVHFDAYVSLSRRPVVSGAVSLVSADALADPRTGSPYYALRVTVPREEVLRLSGVRLQPGMQATVMVKTGERSLIAYLFRPLLRRFAGALGEH